MAMQTDKIVTFQLAGILRPGRTFAYREKPKGGSADDPLVRQCVAAANALEALDKKAQELPRAHTIGEGRDALAGEHARVQVELAKSEQMLTRAEHALAKTIQAFENPPPISSVADILTDTGLRDYFDGADQQKLFPAMARGQFPELLNALARFPVGPAADRAKQIFRDRARAENPAKVEAIATEEERLSWARVGMVDQIVDVLGNATDTLGPSTLVETAALQ